MSKLDSAREELGWLKVVFAVVVAIDASLIAWVAQAHDSGRAVLFIMAFLAIASLTGLIVWLNRIAYRRIRELENL